MSKVLFNPTNEEMRQFVGGVEYVLKPFPQEGHKVRVDDRTANFITTKLGTRGIMTLEYGDEGDIEEKKRVEGVRRNIEFKKKCVINFNQLNGQRENEKLGYLHPNDKVREYARELSIDLKQPFSIEEVSKQTDAEWVAKLQDDNRHLKETVGKLTGQVERLLEALKEKISTDKTFGDTEAFGLYNKMKQAEFTEWVKKEWNGVIPKMSDVVQNDIRVRWKKWNDAPYPH